MTSARPSDLVELAQAIRQSQVELVRFSWCDVHGMLRGKTLTAPAAIQALEQGVSMVSTLMLKDTSDRTAFKVFEPGIQSELPGFGYANNLQLHPIACTWNTLPWAHATGWVQCQPRFQDGASVPYDTRTQLLRALDQLAARNLQMMCGLELEFHIYKLGASAQDHSIDPMQSAWPPPAPSVQLIHPGYNLLSEAWFDRSEEPLRIVQATAQSLGLPLSSLEIELGPSQVEAVFEVTDALTAADNLVLFRSAVRQALWRKGYHATFMCRPPFPNIMSSGWHLHQSLKDLTTGRNAFQRSASLKEVDAHTPASHLSELGNHYLGGLIAHGRGMTALCAPTANAFGRFRPNALAPQYISWGQDNRGAMLRVIGPGGHEATRIENRLGEPAANPYLYFASQIHAGLSGMDQGLSPPPATLAPYDAGDGSQPTIPTTLAQALDALEVDTAMNQGLGSDFIRYYARIKRAEHVRHSTAEDAQEFDRREYFARI